MTIELYFHPLASFCWKPLIALFEHATVFVPRVVDLMKDQERTEFLKLSPHGKFPVIRDTERGKTILESSIIIEYLEQYHPGAIALLPRDPDRARDTRYWDRYYDSYVQEPMQKIVADRLRPKEHKDPYGVEQAKAQLETAYAVVDTEMRDKTWAIGDEFTMADCAAAPALFYANKVLPFGAGHAVTAAYLDRLQARPSFARVLHEATPYFHLFPTE
jgi:glutathione S-transferase